MIDFNKFQVVTWNLFFWSKLASERSLMQSNGKAQASREQKLVHGEIFITIDSAVQLWGSTGLV